MDSLNNDVQQYTKLVQQGTIQKAYQGIMAFMSALRSDLIKQHPDYVVGALYFGYMDMTYFGCTPLHLKERNLKIAIVYRHECNRFEAWLGGSNRQVQAQFIDSMKGKNLKGYKLSAVGPGIDSIIETTLIAQPDFDDPHQLMKDIKLQLDMFVRDMIDLM